MSVPENRQRSVAFSSSTEPRFWWHRLPQSNYIPPIYASLSAEEWQLMSDWYADTSRENLVGECAVPLMTLLHGFITGSGIRRIVQLGTHTGYSTLLIGFFLRQMEARAGLFTLEIDEAFCAFTNSWIERAGLDSYLQVAQVNSLDPTAPIRAQEYLGGLPQLVFLDSSHEYASTLQELDLWYAALAPGGLLVLHDTSAFAANFDVTEQGGVARAFREWRAAHPQIESFSLNHDVRAIETPTMVYQDFCGAGLIQKPLESP